MSAVPLEGRLAAARSDVERACDLLIRSTPEALHGCQDALERAVRGLADVPAQAVKLAADPAIPLRAKGLRSEVLRARHLLERLAGFYQGWERILGTMSGGYSANGDPVPLTRLGRLDCRG